jgi:NTE family protein
MSAPVTAFVLGGAGNMGAIQLGMLRALLERGITPDLVVGCSAGALNGGAIASAPTLETLARLEALWLDLSRSDVWPTSTVAGVVRLLRRGPALNGNEGLRRVVERFLPAATFADLAVPFACVATSLDTGRERWFSDGPLTEAILASAALPVLLPPIEIDGEAFVDGATVNVVPLGQALAMGATRLFILQIKDLDVTSRRPRRPLDVLVRSFAISRNSRFVRELAALPAGVEAHVLPSVPWPRLRYDGFSRTSEIVERSHAAAAAYLEAQGLGDPPAPAASHRSPRVTAMVDSPVNLSASGPPETILGPEADEALAALEQALGGAEEGRRDAVSAVVARFPRFLDGWAQLGALARDDVEAYACFRVGYHRGLDRLRQSGWRGSGFVRWRHPTNRGFLRSVQGLARRADAIGELDEAERCRQFLDQLDPGLGTGRPSA